MATTPYSPALKRYESVPSGWFRRCGTSGLHLPAISLGCWHSFGDPGTDAARHTDEASMHENAQEMLFAAFDNGITHFDLAATVAAVDIGTNSVKITVGRREGDGTVTTLFDDTRITRLGKNVDASGKLDPEAVKRTLDALTEFGQQAKTHGAERVAAVGTSALRDAANGAEFVSEAEQASKSAEALPRPRMSPRCWSSDLRNPAASVW